MKILRQQLRFFCATLMFIMASGASNTNAWADINEKDVLIIGRILSFVQGIPDNEVSIGIVSTGGSSTNDANDFIQIVGGGKKVGSITLKATSLHIDDLHNTSAKVLVIPSNIGNEHYQKIFNTAENKKIVTIGMSEACTNAKKCAISIQTTPAVDIRMSASASSATNVKFESNMMMMIKEVP